MRWWMLIISRAFRNNDAKPNHQTVNGSCWSHETKFRNLLLKHIQHLNRKSTRSECVPLSEIFTAASQILHVPLKIPSCQKPASTSLSTPSYQVCLASSCSSRHMFLDLWPSPISFPLISTAGTLLSDVIAGEESPVPAGVRPTMYCLVDVQFKYLPCNLKNRTLQIKSWLMQDWRSPAKSEWKPYVL